MSQKSSHLLTLCNFVKSEPIFKISALLESVWNLLQKRYNNIHLTLGTLLNYLGKLKIQICADIQQIWKKSQINCILSAPILIALRV